MVTHQGPTKASKSNPEVADIYGAVYEGYEIGRPWLLGDTKPPGKYDVALTQTAKYVHDVIYYRNDAAYQSC